MPLKTQNPADAVVCQGSDSKSFPANCNSEYAFTSRENQAISWLARRARISLSVASAVAAANSWGRS